MTTNNSSKFTKRLLRFIAVLFILINVIAFFHSYKFTHFSDKVTQKTDANTLTATQKAGILFFGIDNPRPVITAKPSQPYKTVTIDSNKKTECWSIKTPNAKGTVILFHGYGGNKSQMIDKSDEFIALGYNTLLVDFMGSGGSEGNTTTIGFFEAQQVKSCYDYLVRNGEKNIHLFGTSMGAAAILKAINDYTKITPKSIIIECPFGSMYKTVCTRFRIMGAPEVPMAGLLVFWGGLQNGFWAFNHNPEAYAKKVSCPVLLMYGEKDNRVSREETNSIYNNLKGRKQLVLFPLAGHENYLNNYSNKWKAEVNDFLSGL
ncbi:MAG: alpha/beta hydrolase [Flavobacterium psychrophilum]|nr:MAG: alpha/beta hydrolase [Flavobacterium psychrophilum]